MLPPRSAHAARVALAATLLIGVVYVGCVIALDRAVTARLVAAVDTRLHERLADAAETGPAGDRADGQRRGRGPGVLWRGPAGARAVR